MTYKRRETLECDGFHLDECESKFVMKVGFATPGTDIFKAARDAGWAAEPDWDAHHCPMCSSRWEKERGA